MSDLPEFQSFDDFWPFYVKEHRKKANRALHFAGTSMALGAVAAAVVTRRPLLLLAAPVLGYGAAWVGHFFVEQNKPASFKHPVWSFMGDFKMYGLMLRGKMTAEVDRILDEDLARRDAEVRAQAVHAEGSVAN